MTPTLKRIAILALAASLAACQTKDPDNQRAVGAVTGALFGAFIGYNMFGSGSGRAVMAMLGAGAGAAAGLYAIEEIIKRDKKKWNARPI